jgi:hypothetical protein
LIKITDINVPTNKQDVNKNFINEMMNVFLNVCLVLNNFPRKAFVAKKIDIDTIEPSKKPVKYVKLTIDAIAKAIDTINTSIIHIFKMFFSRLIYFINILGNKLPIYYFTLTFHYFLNNIHIKKSMIKLSE